MPRTSLLPALAVALVAASAACSAQTVISGPCAFPIIIDQPGAYVLGSNFNVPAQTTAFKI